MVEKFAGSSFVNPVTDRWIDLWILLFLCVSPVPYGTYGTKQEMRTTQPEREPAATVQKLGFSQFVRQACMKKYNMFQNAYWRTLNRKI